MAKYHSLRIVKHSKNAGGISVLLDEEPVQKVISVNIDMDVSCRCPIVTISQRYFCNDIDIDLKDLFKEG